MADGVLARRALSLHDFDYIFLVEFLGFSAVTILFLFYFNRLFAFIVSNAIRAWVWHKYQAYVNVQALQFSLLGGRIFFKGVRYHGRNETILVHDGYITWRYWLRRVRQVDIGQNGLKTQAVAGNEKIGVNGRQERAGVLHEQAGKGALQDLPCRVVVEARGLEWFVYNRTPAYDTVLAGMSKPAGIGLPSQNGKDAEKAATGTSRSPVTTEDLTAYTPSPSDCLEEKTGGRTTSNDKTASISHTNSNSTSQPVSSYPMPTFLNFLPIGVECKKGAIVVGNENTRSVLITRFDHARGQVDARASGTLDLYQQSFDLEFEHPIVQLKPNQEYKESQLEAAAILRGGKGKADQTPRKPRRSSNRHGIWHHVSQFPRWLVSSLTSSRGQKGSTTPESKRTIATHSGEGHHQETWQGLSRYLEEDEDGHAEQERWKAVEYGSVYDIVDSPSVVMSFFWDVPGPVTLNPEDHSQRGSQASLDINGNKPPAWGLNLRVGGGKVTYGPWADRQRTYLQSFFFPSLSADAIVPAKLQPGDTRISTVFKVVIELDREVTLRIPTREESKDWKWKDHAATAGDLENRPERRRTSSKVKRSGKPTLNPEVRPYGWLDITVAADSSIAYTMDMIASASGYRNMLDLDLKAPEMSTSVNHGLLWRSKSQTINCDLSNPREWNTPRSWSIDVRSEELDLFLLRDHQFLLSDLISDWLMGPPADFYTFVPFSYALKLCFPNFKLYLNANDANIINNPSALDDNTLLLIWGKELNVDIGIPALTYRPLSNKVTFDVDAYHGGFKLLTPTWNTQHTLLDTSDVATLKELRVDGSYAYRTSTGPTLTDTVLLNIDGVAPTIHLYGFLIRYFMALKDNYFGIDLHFQTLDEYQRHINKPRELLLTGQDLQHARPTNDIDVILTVNASDASLMLPANLYSAKENIKLDLSSILLDLRFTNYYMDLDVSFSPLSISRLTTGDPQVFSEDSDSSTQVFLDGIVISGHRLFGLPPDEPTYVCNWDFNVGAVTGECTADFLSSLLSALNCIAFTFSDAENALPPFAPLILHDVTFLRAKIEPVKVIVPIDNAAFLFSTDGINVEFNDWAGMQFSDRLHLAVPNIRLICMENRRVSRTRNGSNPESATYAYFQTTIDVRMVETKPQFSTERRLQQDHLSTHDARTKRTPWLLHNEPAPQLAPQVSQWSKTRIPAMPFPPMPEPVHDFDTTESYRIQKSSSSGSVASKRSMSGYNSFFSARSIRHMRPSASTESKHEHSVPQDPGPAIRPSISSTRAAGWASSTNRSTRQHSFIHSSENLEKGNRTELLGSSITFSSSYEVPYFPLLSLRPDLLDIPSTARIEDLEPNRPRELWGDKDSVQVLSGEQPHTTFMVEFISGITGLCTPHALTYANSLLNALQTQSSETLLDNLQISAMEKVLSDTSETPAPKPTQLRLEIPFALIRFKNEAHLRETVSRERQCFDVNASKLVLTARLAPNTELGEELEKPPTSLHMSMKRLSIVATSTQIEELKPEAQLNLALSNVISWLVVNQGLRGELQFQDLQVISLKRSITPLVSMFSRTLGLLEPIIHQFDKSATNQKSRARYLVFSLAKHDPEVPDPAFLTSASYVLRSAVVHPRSSDTWKVVSRLRFVLQQLSIEARQQLNEKIIEGPIVLPPKAREEVIANFNQWRSWDLQHIQASPLLHQVFGSSTTNQASAPASPLNPYKFSLKAGRLQLLIDPGPEGNAITLENLFVDMTSTQSVIVSLQNGPVSAAKRRVSIVEISCAKASAHLNWELCKIVEDFHEHSIRLISAETEPAEDTPKRLSVLDEQSVHLILVVRSSDFKFDSINLGIAALNQGLSTSLILSTTPTAGIDVSGIVNSEIVTCELSTHTKELMITELLDPSIQIALQHRQSGSVTENVLQVAALCSKIDTDIREDLLGLLGVADLVLGDEFASVYMMLNSFKVNTPDQTVPDPSKSIVTKIHANLFLDGYSVALTVLPSLRYMINGAVIRCSMSPTVRQAEGLMLNFDVKENTHTFLNYVNGSAQQISELPMPSVTGRVVLGKRDSIRSITVFIGVEKVNLDASAVHGLVSTLSRAELSSFRTSIVHDIDLISSHFNGIVDVGTSKTVTPAPKDEILYLGRVTTAGLDIGTTIVKGKDSSARLHFEVGYVSFKVSNHGIESREVLHFPEIEVGCQGIKVLLERAKKLDYSPCGNVELAISFRGSSKRNDAGDTVRSYLIKSDGLEINLFTETASVIVDILGHLQQRFKTLDLSHEVRNLRDRRRLRAKSQALMLESPKSESKSEEEELSETLFKSMYALEVNNIQVSWRVGDLAPSSPGHEVEDLVLTVARIDLATQKHNAARLTIESFQLQMVPVSQSRTERSFNSALLPEVVFNVAYLSTSKDRRFAFQAAGKSLDLRLTSQFILPASDLQRSIAIASQELRKVVADWNASWPQSEGQTKNVLGNKKLSSLLVDADFAGASVYIQGKKVSDPQLIANNMLRGGRLPQHGRYGQFTHEDASSSTTLRAPGIAVKVEYKNLGVDDPSLNAEIKVDASTNVLFPTIVPLILEISSSVKEIVGEPEEKLMDTDSKPAASKFLDDKALQTADPVAILGDCRLNLGLRICRQQFSLSCQPIARVAATAQFENIYITVNTVQSTDQSRFFAVSAVFSRPQASVQHVYSRESTGGFEVESINISLMNSKHVSANKGLSAIVKISPTKVLINVKQLHDFLLFREIWIPVEMRHSQPASSPPTSPDSPAFAVQRYQQVAAAGAFPWNATLSITKLDVQLDLGQALGKSKFSITDFWVSSKKTSDWEQNLCLGFDRISIDSTGRMSGAVVLQNLQLRTSIWWPAREEVERQTPLIQASFAFDDLRIKIAFDYQAFLVADIASLDFLMYNLRHTHLSGGDRLVGIVKGDKIQAFCTTSSSAQGLGLYQAVQRLIQDKQSAYQTSLKDIEKYLRRNSSVVQSIIQPTSKPPQKTSEVASKAPIRLQTNVVVAIGTINIGAFPSTFYDNQIFKLEALDASARFTVAFEDDKVQSDLGLTLGQLRIALSSVSKPSAPKTLGEVSVEEVVQSATSSRGGTILKVPKVVATMQTWQAPESYQIDYIFKSSFEGKVEVGWNYSRISFIRGMWAKHSRALAQRLGKPLPPSALQITGGPEPDSGVDNDQPSSSGEQEKITAVVNVPQSKYQYTALEPPIIETPQLRDMGEATPPLEWIGLHRERLPNLTHQIIIVTLLEVAKEVDDAYSKILGSS